MRALLDVRPLWEHRAFRRLWLGTTASGFGSQLGNFAVTYHVWNHSHNAVLVGLIGLFIAGPLIGVALLGSAVLAGVVTAQSGTTLCFLFVSPPRLSLPLRPARRRTPGH